DLRPHGPGPLPPTAGGPRRAALHGPLRRSAWRTSRCRVVVGKMRTDWQAAQRRAAAQLDELVRGLLAELGRRAWGAARGGSWDIVAPPGEAAWRLYHLGRPGPAEGCRYQELGVRATIAPNGGP